MASSTEINIAENIKFYGSLMGTQGITEENNKICNNRIQRLLIALEPFTEEYEEEAKHMIEERKAERARIEAGDDEETKIIAPTGYDMNNLKIR